MYISAEKIAAMEGVRRVHNLNPAAIRIDKSLGDEVGLKNIGIHLISIAPGDKSTEFHTHRYEEEATAVNGISWIIQPLRNGKFVLPDT